MFLGNSKLFPSTNLPCHCNGFLTLAILSPFTDRERHRKSENREYEFNANFRTASLAPLAPVVALKILYKNEWTKQLYASAIFSPPPAPNLRAKKSSLLLTPDLGCPFMQY